MDYDKALRDPVFLQDETARLTVAAADMAPRKPFRPVYGDLELSRAYQPGPVMVDDITDDDLDRAVAQLAMARGEDYRQTWAQVRSLAGGERDIGSLAAGIVELARSDPGTIELAATIGAEDRRALAAKGQALPDGSYPIPDKSHLRAATVLAASGHGNVAAARKLIRKRAEELGVDLDSLPGFGSSSGEEEDREEDEEEERGSRRRRKAKGQAGPVRETGGGWGSPAEAPGPSGGAGEGASVAAAQRQRWARAGVVGLTAGDYDGQLELAQSESEEDRIAREHPEYFGGERPRAKGQRAETRVEDEDPTVRRHPSRGGVPHPEVARYVRELHRGGFGGAEKPHGSVVMHRRAG
jgi:hypothetical protein